MYILMYIISCYDGKDVHYSFPKKIHRHKMYYISGRWRRAEGAVPSTPPATYTIHFMKMDFCREGIMTLATPLTSGPPSMT